MLVCVCVYVHKCLCVHAHGAYVCVDACICVGLYKYILGLQRYCMALPSAGILHNIIDRLRMCMCEHCLIYKCFGVI